ncbi:leucine-rich repeat domain-containing protein [Paracidovorax citrulli]
MLRRIFFPMCRNETPAPEETGTRYRRHIDEEFDPRSVHDGNPLNDEGDEVIKSVFWKGKRYKFGPVTPELYKLMSLQLDEWVQTQTDPRCAKVKQRVLDCYTNGERSLDLSNLGMTNVPDVLAWLTGLKVLRLGGNPLNGIPYALQGMLLLEVLELYNNRIKEFPSWFRHLCRLRIVNIGGNRFRRQVANDRVFDYTTFLWFDEHWKLELPSRAIPCSCCEIAMLGDPPSAYAVQEVKFLLREPGQQLWWHQVRQHRELSWRPGAMPPASRAQWGRLAVLLHGAPGGVSPPLPPLGGGKLPPDMEQECDELFWMIEDLYAREGMKDKAERSARPHPERVELYRLDLIRRMLSADPECFDRYAPTLFQACEGTLFHVLQALDEVELALAQEVVAQSELPPGFVVEFGRGVHRMNLLSELFREAWMTGRDAEKVKWVLRTLLVGPLSLPIEVRRLVEFTWLNAIPPIEVFLPQLRDSVLKRESERDFERLDEFMANWEPWRRTVLRNTGADASGPGFTALCREGFRAHRRGKDEGFAIWCSERRRDARRAARAGRSERI